MKILVVEPGKHPYAKEIPNTLDSLHKVVGGYIQAIYPFPEAVALVCDEEGLYKPEQKWNRLVDRYGAIKGTFFICGLAAEDFADLPPALMEKYKRRFWDIVRFVPTPKGLLPIILHEQQD